MRIVRETRPDVIVTMDPSPSPGNHGNHQYAARLATEAFYAAADPDEVPGAAARARAPRHVGGRSGSSATARPGSGPVRRRTARRRSCKSEPTDNVFGVWMGTPSAAHGGQPWWHILWDAAHEYLSQGFGAFPSPPDLPFIIPCNTFTQIASRVAVRRGEHGDDGDLPGRVGARLRAGCRSAPSCTSRATASTPPRASRSRSPPTPRASAAHAEAGERRADAAGGLDVDRQRRPRRRSTQHEQHRRLHRDAVGDRDGRALPDRGHAERPRRPQGNAAGGRRHRRDEPRRPRRPGRARARCSGCRRSRSSSPGRATTGVPQLGGLVKPVLSIGIGETRPVRVDLHNWSGAAKSGTRRR